MKLPELKKVFNNKYVVRVIAGVLTIAMVGTGASVYTVRAEKDGENPANKTQVTTEASENTDSLASLLDQVSVEQKEIGKQETVYFLSDANGKVNKTIVADHLINTKKEKELKDKSSLKDIENVKGEESFKQDGDSLTWQENQEK